MADYVHSIFIIFAEIYCCILLFQSFAGKRNKKNKFITLLEAVVLSCFYFIITMVFSEQFYLRAMGIFLITSIMMFQIRYSKALVLSMFYYGVDLIVEYATIVIIGRVFTLVTGKALDLSDLFTLNMVSVMSKALLLSIILYMRKMIGKKTPDVLTAKEWWVLFVISFITIFSLVAIVVKIDLFNHTNQQGFFLYIAMGVLAINFIVYYLINDIMEREMKLREHAVFREKVKSETAMYHSISENLEKQRKRTHEYKNQIAAISALGAGEQYQELNAYIEKINNALELSMDAVDTNHVIVNAILNTKYREAVSKGMVFVLKVNDLSKLKIEEEDIIVILSNLLNNALDKDKVIKFKFVLEGEQVVISVKNNMETEPVVENGEFVTTKTKEAGEHGMGIRNVIETVEKYGGRYVIDYDKKNFQFSILIPNN